MNGSKYFQKLLLIILVFLCSGCATVSQTQNNSEETKRFKNNKKVSVEAYLFDAKLKQHGKPTSVRLFFYQTDSVIAIGGKGYLGKGALKGWINNDSILVTFPTLREYLHESIEDLFASFSCESSIPKFNLMSLFTMLPDESDDFAFADVTMLQADSKRPQYRIQFPHCKWKIKVTYDKKSKGYRIRNFTFNDGQGTSLTGKRREYKGKSKVSQNKFEAEISAGMSRIIP